jgi:casein kinase I family protein HRR25
VGFFGAFHLLSLTVTFSECSRRDDLESLAYMLIYFLRGTLPWRRIKGENITETWNLIRDKKIEVEPLLTVGLPAEFDVLFKYARGLDFDDLPDYEGLRALFRGLAERQGIEYDEVYDWTLGKSKSRKRFCEACNARCNARR